LKLFFYSWVRRNTSSVSSEFKLLTIHESMYEYV